MATVSVVIPTYNRASVVGRAIDSALAQTINDVEVIVIDDASTDGTESTVREYDVPVRYLAHENNRGGGAARNTGIAHADGEFVAFLDSDDEWHPRKVERQVTRLRDQGEAWGGVYCNFQQARTSRLGTFVDRAFERDRGQEGGEALLQSLLLLEVAFGGSSTLLIRAEVLDELSGFDPSFERQQDWEFLVRFLQRWNLAYVDERLVTKHDTGLPDLETVARARQRYLQKFATQVVDLSLEEHAVVGRHRFALAKVAFANGEFDTGLSYLRRSTIPTVRDALGLCRAVWVGLGRS